MKTIEDLLNSEYAERFDIKISPYRDDVIHIYLPHMISFPIKNIKITDNGGHIWIENMTFSLTLYKVSVSTHLTIF